MNHLEPSSRPEPEHAWERRLAAELRALPELEAPASLVSDVMAIVRTREAMRAQAWWRRPAVTWHPALRVGFGVVALALLGGILLGVHIAWPGVQASSEVQSVSAFGGKLSALWSAAQTVVDAIALVVRAVLTPTRLAILAGVIVAHAALLSAGAAAFRVTMKPRMIV